MSFDLAELMETRKGENFRLHSEYLNPQLVKVLKTLGFDRYYERGEGCYLYDGNGEKYLDFLSGFGVFALGRSHPVLKQAMSDALALDLPNLAQLDCALLPGLLAEALVGTTHAGINRCFFSNSGAEAIECAIKFAKYATHRPRIVHANHAFHGLTNGALSLNGGADFTEGFGPLLPGCDTVEFGDLVGLERELRRGDVAAFVVEIIQGKGVYMADQAYWSGVQELCKRHSTLFVADEVQTGLGRTGQMWAYEHYGLAPDMITVSKALSGGYIPVAATLCSQVVFDAVFSKAERAVVHSSTFGRNQLAMAAGLATLRVLDDEDVVARAAATGKALTAALEPLVERYDIFKEVRGLGLMIGLEFGEPSTRTLRSGWKMLETIRKGLFSQLVVGPLFTRHRILTQVAADGVNIVKLLPPLIAGDEEVSYFVKALDDVLQDVHKNSALIVGVGRMAKGALAAERS